MKRIVLCIVFALVAVVTVKAQEWTTDFEVAKKTAQKDQKPIILVFQGSDWCAPCIKLDREIWSSPEFQEYSKKNYVMLQADFPRKAKNQLPDNLQTQNKALAAKYNPNGYFPFVVVLNAKGDVLGQTSYQKVSPKDYIKILNSFIK